MSHPLPDVECGRYNQVESTRMLPINHNTHTHHAMSPTPCSQPHAPRGPSTTAYDGIQQEPLSIGLVPMKAIWEKTGPESDLRG